MSRLVTARDPEFVFMVAAVSMVEKRLKHEYVFSTTQKCSTQHSAKSKASYQDMGLAEC
jgi:hypothetical protein